MTLTLLDRDVSGNCWRVRLMLSVLGLPYQRIEVDIVRGDQFEPSFLALNPRAQVPVLVERLTDDMTPTVVWDSCAILVWLAGRFDRSWLAHGFEEETRQQQWLAVATTEHQQGIRAARGATRFGFPTAPEALDRARDMASRSLAFMDAYLAERPYLVASRPTVADVACYAYASVAPEGGIDTTGLSSLNRWMRRLETLPGYEPLGSCPIPSRSWKAGGV